MLDVVKVQCPSCAGSLEVDQDLDRFTCGYCGTQVVVRRGGGTVSLGRVQRGVDRTASELAIKRLEGEIAPLRAALARGRNSVSYYDMLGGVGTALAIAGAVLVTKPGNGDWTVLLLIGLAVIASALIERRGATKQLARVGVDLMQRESELARHRETVRL